ncbi:MAG: VWA domain-containing protein [Alistipes sp.]|nr:VWA domain-containing protein [Alistipes sp.]
MYQQQITHHNRGAFVLMLDCSASMGGMTRLNNVVMSKAEAVALVSNMIIDELMERATRHHIVRDYYDIAVIGYQEQSIRSLLPEVLGNGFVSVKYLSKFAPAHKVIHLDQQLDNGGVVSSPFSYRPWINPISAGHTPMYEALIELHAIVEEWCSCSDNYHSFPPVVINITDGECNDASAEDLVTIAQSIKNTHTADGHTLFINVHLSTLDELTSSTLFPAERGYSTEDGYRQMLFDMSSSIPQSLEPLIADIIQSQEAGPYRAVAFNASPIELFSILNIGSESIGFKR